MRESDIKTIINGVESISRILSNEDESVRKNVKSILTTIIKERD
jgi:hypothetical protein